MTSEARADVRKQAEFTSAVKRSGRRASPASVLCVRGRRGRRRSGDGTSHNFPGSPLVDSEQPTLEDQAGLRLQRTAVPGQAPYLPRKRFRNALGQSGENSPFTVLENSRLQRMTVFQRSAPGMAGTQVPRLDSERYFFVLCLPAFFQPEGWQSG